MKKPTSLLLLLLISCAPLGTEASTSTAIPSTVTITSTPTMTPEPTNTPEPTATQPPYRIGANNEVEIFMNGKYVDLKPPEGVWGPVDGIKVVLVSEKNGEKIPYIQLKLQMDFLDTDGDDILNVAKFDKNSGEWMVLPDILILQRKVESKKTD